MTTRLPILPGMIADRWSEIGRTWIAANLSSQPSINQQERFFQFASEGDATAYERRWNGLSQAIGAP